MTAIIVTIRLFFVGGANR